VAPLRRAAFTDPGWPPASAGRRPDCRAIPRAYRISIVAFQADRPPALGCGAPYRAGPGRTSLSVLQFFPHASVGWKKLPHDFLLFPRRGLPAGNLAPKVISSSGRCPLRSGLRGDGWVRLLAFRCRFSRRLHGFRVNRGPSKQPSGERVTCAVSGAGFSDGSSCRGGGRRPGDRRHAVARSAQSGRRRHDDPGPSR
jgi:hypothetical protein